MTIIFYNFLPFSNSKLMPCTSVWICNIIRLLYVINVKGSVSSEITKLFLSSQNYQHMVQHCHLVYRSILKPCHLGILMIDQGLAYCDIKNVVMFVI